MQSDSNLRLHRLGNGLTTAFEWIARRHRLGEISNLAVAWASLVDSAVNGLRLDMYPAVDPGQMNFAFTRPHVIETEYYAVAGGGMRGGSNVDLVFQLWIETDEISIGVGFPLIFLAIPETGGIPQRQWAELQATCRELLTFSPATRVVLFASGHDFQFERMYGPKGPILAIDGVTVAGLRRAPRPTYGIDHYSLAQNLACGNGGDPQISGFHPDQKLMTELLKTFHVAHVLRLRIKVDPRG